jgi:ATP-binding cassette subfamily B protein
MKKTIKWHINTVIKGYRVFSSAVTKPVLLAKSLAPIASACVPFINIWFFAQILNELTGKRDSDRLLYLVLLTLGLNLFAYLIQQLFQRWENYCNAQTYLSLFNIFTNKIFALDYLDVENPEIQQEQAEIRGHQLGMGFGLLRLNNLYNNMIDGFIKMILAVGLSVSLFTQRVPEGSSFAYLDSPLALVVFILLLVCVILLAPFLSMVGGRIWATFADENSFVNRLFVFYFVNITMRNDRAKDIRIYKQQKTILDEINGITIINSLIKRGRYAGKYNALGSVVSFLANGLIFLFIAMKAHAGAFGVGSILLYVGAVQQFGGGFSAVMMSIGDLVNNNPYLDRAFRFLNIPNKKYQGTIPVEKRDDVDYVIEFKNVSFQYPNSETYALRNVNLKLNVGTRLAVVGMNGSGKTTMIKLLCRLYDPTEGQITLNGIDIKKYDYDEYMAIFGVVFQDFALMPFTLGQNVAASVDYDTQRVKHVLALSGFASRLDSLPEGLDTYLGKEFEETGVEMSGGEAQKIALARALYKNSPFIVLDEPTAALDPIAEYEIYSAFNEIVGDKTAVYISHRLSSCRFCDDIVVFHEGQMIQRGNHDTLLSDIKGKYHELWNAQAQYYTEEAAV